MRKERLLFAFILFANCSHSDSQRFTNENGKDSVNSAIEKSETSNSNVQHKKNKVPKGRCDIDTIVKTDENINTLTSDDIYKFLFTFSEDCKSNAEFTEISNEVLFKVLLKYPKTLSASLKKDSIHKQIILEEIANPVIELKSLDKTIKAIKILQVPDTVKTDLIKKLKDAM